MFLRKVFLIFSTISNAFGANILCVFFVPSFSHQIVFQSIWKELSLRGHKVTVITPNPLNDSTLTNLTEIDTSFTYEVIRRNFIQKDLAKESYVYQSVLFLYKIGLDMVETLLNHSSIKYLLNDNKTNFGLVIFQNTNNYNLVLGIVGRYKCPSIGISSMGLFLQSHDAVGNPTHPLLSPDVLLGFGDDKSFFDKVNSLLFNIWYRMFYYWYAVPEADRIARKYFGDDMPYLGDIEKNVSLLMTNVNPIIHPIRANVPNVIEISQLHIKKKKPLSKDLQDYLDNSPQGVVYFSLGTNVKSANLSTEIKHELLSCFNELPYNILWKFEDENVFNGSRNVLTKKWLPQQDVLGHPNVKVFITQGGLQSIEEAIYNEVPLIGIPFIMDQPTNINKIVKLGMGLKLDYQNLRKDDLKKAIIDVVENNKYKKAVQKSKSILSDQPMVGVEKAIWWIEYVLRHNGASHLRSAAADMSFFEYFMVDVVIFLLICTLMSLYVVCKLVFLIIGIFRTVRKIKQQ